MQSHINCVNTSIRRSIDAQFCRIKRSGRLPGVLLALLLACAYGALAESPAVFAADHTMIQVPPDPFTDLSQKIIKVTDNIKKIATPIAGLCIALVFIMNLGAPVLPEFAQQNKGYVMRALGIVAFISIIPELIALVSSVT